MKILFVTNKPPYPLADGGCIATFNFVDGFAKAGHDVHVLSFSTKKHPGRYELLTEQLRAEISFTFVDVDTDISTSSALRNLFFSRKPYNAERFIDDGFEEVLLGLLRHEDFDVVQLEGLYVCPYIATIRRASTALIGYRSHNIESEIWVRSAANERNVAKKHYLKLLAKRIACFERTHLNKYDCLVPITGRDASVYKKLGNKRPVHIAPVGYDIAKWNTSQSVGSFPDLFYLGALDWMPNQEGLLWFLEKVWGKLHEKYPKLKFNVAGRNASDKLETELKKHSGVVYLGEVPVASEFIASQGIMVVPLLSGGGMRVKIIEGMALGKTIVTSSVGAEGIHAVSGENILIADTEENFFAELCSLIENEVFFRRIGLHARAFVEENYDNAVISGYLLQFYESLLKNA